MPDEKKVVGLFGEVPQPGEVNQNALKAIEDALGRVKEEGVVGVVVAMVYADGATNSISGGFCKGRAIAGMLFELMQDAVK